jgi:peroxiredoxin
MALTESNMLPLGTRAPEFQLEDVTSNSLVSPPAPGEFPATLIMFICNHCPYVVHVLPGLLELCGEYAEKGVRIIAISSNDAVRYPADAPEKMRELALQEHFGFPYCYDGSQEVARAYDAACTPDFYVFDRNMQLAYRGRMDASRPGNGIPVTGSDLRLALDAVLEEKEISTVQYPSAGCNIKWKTD